MRFTGLALIALAFAPAAAFAAMTADQVLGEAAKLPPKVPGQYHLTFELLEVDPAVDPAELEDALRSEDKEELKNSDSCESPDEPIVSAGVELVENVFEDGCVFDQFEVSGETVNALVQCPADQGGPERIKMVGRMGADSAEMLMTSEQSLPDKSTFRMTMRLTSQRVGECA